MRQAMCHSLWAVALGISPAVPTWGQHDVEVSSAVQPQADAVAEDPTTAEKRPPLPPPEGARPLAKNGEFAAWVDGEKGVVYIDGEVSLRAGVLEMFACQRFTKEHESIVALDSPAFPIHAALLALGAEPGGPVQFQPEFVPPAGTEIAIEVRWLDEHREWQSARAQEWVRNVKTEKEMEHPWVFAGSQFWTDPSTGRRHYTAENGDFICVSNFSTAMLDVPIESTQANEGLFFEAHTERIPPLGTQVRLVLKPVLADEASAASTSSSLDTPAR